MNAIATALAERRLSTTEAARVLGVEEGTLANWRCTGRHELPYYKIGRRVTYKESDLVRFIESRRRI